MYFRNQRVEPSSDYTYDAIYRLVDRHGREHLGQTNGAARPAQQITDDDGFRTGLLQPSDGNAMGTYTERYQYDPVGNLLRADACRLERRLDAQLRVPRAVANHGGGDEQPADVDEHAGRPGGGPVLGHVRARCARQHDADAAPAGDGMGRARSPALDHAPGGEHRQRPRRPSTATTPAASALRKVTDRQAPAGQTRHARERADLSRRRSSSIASTRPTASTVKLERETLHLSDGPNRVALVETRTQGTDTGLPVVVRYQHGNHLGSAMLELDDAANVITYEEYFPYGSTSYQAVRSQTETPKRYRYTGKERDDENGLDYFGARYYASWLGRWSAVDPAGVKDAPSLYVYVAANPIRLTDPDGKAAADQEKLVSEPRVAADVAKPPESESGHDDRAEEERRERVAEGFGYAASLAHIADAVIHHIGHKLEHEYWHLQSSLSDASMSEEKVIATLNKALPKIKSFKKLAVLAKRIGIAGGVFAALETAINSKHESKVATGVDAAATGGVETGFALLAAPIAAADAFVNEVAKGAFGKERSYGLAAHGTYSVHLLVALGFREKRTQTEYTDELLAGKGPALYVGEAKLFKRLGLVGALYREAPRYLVANETFPGDGRPAHFTRIPNVNTWFEPVVIHRRHHTRAHKHSAMHFEPTIIERSNQHGR